jgi:hypothetical protein
MNCFCSLFPAPHPLPVCMCMCYYPPTLHYHMVARIIIITHYHMVAISTHRFFLGNWKLGSDSDNQNKLIGTISVP